MAGGTNRQLTESKLKGSNGRLSEPGLKRPNGHVGIPSSKPISSSKGFNLFSAISRLLTWYSIITILFRCPTSIDLITDSTPKVCKPYFQITAAITPHLQPYYDTYASPYVDTVKPYYETLNSKVVSPAAALGKKYGAPRVAQAQALGQAQWEKNIQPQVQKYQGLASDKFDQTVGPYWNQVASTTAPYYDIAKTNAYQTYYGHILPTYNAVQPYVAHGYGIANNFASNTALPYSKWAWASTVIFLDRTVWPRLRILYGENVEPQLIRIGEKFGRYRGGAKIKGVVDAIDRSSSSSSASSTFSSVSSSIAAGYASSSVSSDSVPSTSAPAPAKETKLTEKEQRAKAQLVVAHDLKSWQEKFAAAADEGADELDVRITEITDALIRSQAGGVGKALIIELEQTVESNLKALKSTIISVVKSAKGSPTEESEDAVGAAVRKAGIAIKERAQAVRTWKHNYDKEATSLVTKASQDTFDILDLIRDSGLQEIGMRWAWTDGITHKDWTKYHQLKVKFAEWRLDVEQVVSEHPGLEAARAASQEVEDKAMTVAENAAKELSLIKESGLWKLKAGDTTGDFTKKYMPAAAAAAGQKVKDGSQDSVSSVLSAAGNLAEKASNSVIGTQQGSAQSVASAAKASASSVVEQASSSIIGSSQGSVESAASVVSKSASSLSERASSSIAGSQTGKLEQASNSIKSAASSVSGSASQVSKAAGSSISSASSSLSKNASKASKSLSSASSSLSISVSSSASSVSSSISSSASSISSTASKKVWGGAMAAHVEARQVVYDDFVDDSDDMNFSEKLSSMASQAGDKYSDITKAVSEALLQPSSTAVNAAKTKIAAAKYSAALSAASVAMYGTTQGTVESASSVVSSRYNDAVSAASAAIYGTPVPMTQSLAAQASQAYSDAVSRASEHYSKAQYIISAQVSGTPKPAHEEMFSSVNSAYSDSVAAASSRLQAALSAASTAAYGTPASPQQSLYSAASSAIYGPPQGSLESISSIAASRLSEGLRQASAHYSSATNYAGAIQTGPAAKQKLLSQMRDQYYAGIGMAHAQYSEFLDAASSAVMPKQTPFHESLISRASIGVVGSSTPAYEAAYSSAIAAASSQLSQVRSSLSSLGSSDPAPSANLVDVASSRYSAAIAVASQTYSSLSSAASVKANAGASSVSSAVYGSETPWTEAVASSASQNWEALITKASHQIYGGPTPYFVTRSLLSEAKEYAAAATVGAAAQYAAVQSLISELVSGKEPDYTESVYSRLSSAYYTGAAEAVSSASSYASEAYASASSVVSSVFTAPPTVEAILDSASSHINAAVEAASTQFYGTPTGTYEQATSAAASAYSSVQSVASEKIYGTSVGYAAAAQSSIADAASSAQQAISEAIYGTSTGTYESATSVIGDNMSSATSYVADTYVAAQAKISSAIYGPEQNAVESAQARLLGAVESARARLAEFAAQAGDGASEIVNGASQAVEDFASSVSSAVGGSATGRKKDEL